MNEHEHIDLDLSDFVGSPEELPAEVRARHERHLETCPTCRASVADARRVLDAIATTALSPSPGFDAALFAKLDAIDRSARTEAWRARWRALSSPMRWALALSPVAAGLAWFVFARPEDGADARLPEGALVALGALDEIELGTELELYRDLDAIEYLDVAEDLELLLDEEEAG